MKLEQLITFVTVVETGAINLTAQILSKTQPAISMTIKRLEDSIGFSLFKRENNRLKPTSKGLIYYKKAKVILQQVQQLDSVSESLKSGVEHNVTIAIEDTSYISDMLTPLKKVQSEFPNTELSIDSESRLASLTRLAKGEVDLAISPWLITFASEGEFESKTIKTMSMFNCIHKELAQEYGFDSAADINEDKLLAIPQIVPNEFAVQLNQAKIMRPIGRSIVKVNNLSAMVAALKSKLGWGPLTDTYWNKSMKKDYLRFDIDPNSTTVVSEIRIVRNKFKSQGPVAKKIWDSF